MKKILLAVILMTLFIGARAQSPVSDDDFNKLISHLENEDWKQANILSLACLKKIPIAEQEDPKVAILRFMYIYSEAGLMNDHKLSKAQAEKDVKSFENHLIILPAHPVLAKNGFNGIEMVNEKTDSLFVTEANKNATSIFAFVYVVLKNKWTLDDFKNNVGKFYRTGGILKSISTEGNFLPRFRMIINEATAQQEDH